MAEEQAQPSVVQVPPLPCPAPAVGRILVRRARLWRAARPLLDEPLTPERKGRLLRAWSRVLPTTLHRAMMATVDQYAGERLDRQTWALLAARVAGNEERLRSGEPILRDLETADWEWSVLRCVGVWYDRHGEVGSRGLPRHWRIRVEILTGYQAGLVVDRGWTHAQCSYLAYRAGFNRRAGRPMHTPRELTGLWFLGLLRPGRQVAIARLACAPSYEVRNRQLLTRRQRERCPFGSTAPCWRCAAGLDQCDRAVRLCTLEEGTCSECGESGWIIDPALGREVCHRCYESGRVALPEPWIGGVWTDVAERISADPPAGRGDRDG